MRRALRRYAAWGTLAVAASIVVCSTALAGEAPRQSPASSKLKWQVRSSPVQRASDQSETPSSPRFETQQIAAEAPVHPPSAKSSRAKLRDLIMQVQTDKADPFKDPFADEDRAKNADLRIAPPAQTESVAPPQGEPAPLRSRPDPFPEEEIPSPPTTEAPLPQGLLAPAEGVSCQEQMDACIELVRKLRERDITTIVPEIAIDGVEGQDYPCECKLGNVPFEGRSWSPTKFTWKATGVCHKPLYFEDVQLERYGHSWNPVVQPFMSAGHFFVSVPLLPYKMGLTPPNECMYTLGYYRPGSCAPYVIEPIPLSLRAALYESAAVTGFVFWFWPPAGG
ncbi:MAG: hypothetical protein HY288_12070 [Planctomycetia bacterium]|nr:hypothetical protein [Planctomycetia bacterium]